jgi:hypothetical protein
MNKDGELARFERRIVRFERIIQHFMRNFERSGRTLSFWTAQREQWFYWFMHVYEQDWCALQAWRAQSSSREVKLAWESIDGLAKIIGDFAMKHDALTQMQNIPAAHVAALASLDSHSMRQ